MAMTPVEVLKMAKDNEVKFVDFRFADTRGKEQHERCQFRSLILINLNLAMPLMAPRSQVGKVLKRPTCC